MADNIVRQLCVEFRKKRVLAAKAAETVAENANNEKLQKSKFEKYLDVSRRSPLARLSGTEIDTMESAEFSGPTLFVFTSAGTIPLPLQRSIVDYTTTFVARLHAKYPRT
ncbi:hypothetical protein KIN20_025524 [Parelaphostrongylus tenuis]|uniref:Uncharacterized protein n=1 Tax=Parelaphostrongylus tenuis TaxID=148309 RepID=A0AAD5N8X5_PARTN|nr:hypothetical protein KIN20_025524 [Parelaphostrongylus tenuis]